MIIQEIEIDRFGRWDRVRFSKLTAGVNLFFGPNEAGKTTLKQFVRYVLFGASPEIKVYFAFNDAQKCGGKISVQHIGCNFSVDRETHSAQNAKSDLKVFDARRNLLDNRLIDVLLSNNRTATHLENRTDVVGDIKIDADLYLSVFAIGLQELQELATLASPQLSALLYRLSTGLQRNALQNTLLALRQRMWTLLQPADSVGVLEREEFIRILEQKSKIIDNRKSHTEIIGATGGWILRQMMQRELILSRMEETKKAGENFVQLVRERCTLTSELARAENINEQISHHLKVLRLAEIIRDKWEKREGLDKKIVELRNSHAFLSAEDTHSGLTATENTFHSLAEALKQAGDLRIRLQKLGRKERIFARRHEKLRENDRKVQFFPELLGLLPRMEAILMHEERILGLATHLDSLHDSRAETVSELQVAYQRLGLVPPNFSDAIPEQEIHNLGKTGGLHALRVPARDMRRIIRKRRAVRKSKKDRTMTLAAMLRQVEAYYRNAQHRISAAGQGTIDFSSHNHSADSPDLAFIDVLAAKLGQSTASLRRQIVCFDKMTHLATSEPAAERVSAEAKKRLVVPIDELMISGALFTLGLSLSIYSFLASFFEPWFSYFLYFMLFLGGSAVCVSVFLWKREKEKRQRAAYLESERNLTDLRAEIVSAVSGSSLFAALMPSSECEFGLDGMSAGARKKFLDSLLVFCESESAKTRAVADVYQKELVLLEEQSLAVAKCRALQDEATFCREQVRKNDARLQAARNAYAVALREIGLPPEWNPVNVRNFRRSIPRLQELWRRLQRDAEDLTRYETELQVFSRKMQEILGEISKIIGDSAIEMCPDMKGTGDETVSSAAFPLLREKLHEQMQAREEKSRIRTEMKKVRKTMAKIHTAREKIHARRLAILRRFSVKNIDELSIKRECLEKLRQLYKDRGEIQRNIDSEINFLCDESAIWEVYQKYTPSQLSSRIQLMEQRLAMQADDFRAKKDRAEEVSARLHVLEHDRSLPALRFELTKIEQNILSGIRQWRTLGLAHRLIETVKKTYEQKRQPETLTSASDFLQRLTDGKYVRIWTPVDEEVLRVDREDGKVFEIEQLSTGTCEVLFLALRLALIEGFRRQNLSLPVFFDDILVNFDKKRLRLAVEVLCEFFRPDARTPAGEQPQIFVFTCHEHIKEIFVQQGVNLCEMGK